MRHSTFDIAIRLAFVLAGFLSWFWTSMADTANKQIAIPQGVVLCQTEGPAVILGGKSSYSPEEWDWVQQRAYEAVLQCE